jgi:hypothetical protein
VVLLQRPAWSLLPRRAVWTCRLTSGQARHCFSQCNPAPFSLKSVAQFALLFEGLLALSLISHLALQPLHCNSACRPDPLDEQQQARFVHTPRWLVHTPMAACEISTNRVDSVERCGRTTFENVSLVARVWGRRCRSQTLYTTLASVHMRGKTHDDMRWFCTCNIRTTQAASPELVRNDGGGNPKFWQWPDDVLGAASCAGASGRQGVGGFLHLYCLSF